MTARDWRERAACQGSDPNTIDRTQCPGDQHGSANAYRNHGCRCLDARRANTNYRKRRRAGVHQPAMVDSVGVVRRRQALAVMGYGLPELAPHFGVSPRAVSNYMSRPRVHRSTLARWRQVYDLLSMTPGPNSKARGEALRRGWVPPLAWDDDTIDDPNAAPDRGAAPGRRRAMLAENAGFLAAAGMSTHGIADRLRVSEPYVRGLLNRREVAA